MNAIILAGRNTPSKKEIKKQREILIKAYPKEHYFIGEEDYKPLFKINGHPIIQYVIDACKDSEYIERVFVVGAKSKLEKELNGCSIIENSDSIVRNAQKGYYESNSEWDAVFLGCDIPLIK
jgi:GTP:adenosylcobinamide-phosphate guanylyltransferase